MKVFLTGATGFIGSHIAKQLVTKDYQVYALVRDKNNLKRIEDIVDKIELLEADLLDFKQVNQIIKTILPQQCIHSAWYVEPGKYLNGLENIDLVGASFNLAKQLAECGCEHFLGIGTCFEYDTSLGYLQETSIAKPNSLYGASKLSVQLVLEQIGKITGMKTAWARLFYQYGPAEDPKRLIPGIITALLRGKTMDLTPGEQVRDFLYIEDVANALGAIALQQATGLFNIGSGKPITVKEIALTLGDLMGKPELIKLGALPYRQGDDLFICANNHRLKEVTGWYANHNLQEGLQLTIDWWKSQLS
ncbi:NAD(P)-dependent oxidoreductase [Gloeocapsa sp. PCC 73106]|uniref:NAD-dependent epimerase/dehydratase family protein n=1 Tax=Gloeocapsa sp. PCC 73106 TaxID=102232 RepID=UPI0002ABBCA1|nr:NAD(P)-dependent oxidoreductase [Gloeocapsa sp. PCC 73106]ELR98320.1 nucleoside-diphosphate-sugar epimerase [Gloeocapsa sp. PCC 73106]